MPNIVEAVNAKEPCKISALGLFINPIRDPKVCPTKIKNTMSNILFIIAIQFFLPSIISHNS